MDVQEQLSKYTETIVLVTASAVLSGVGWVARTWATGGNTKMTWKEHTGGVLLAGFVGSTVSMILSSIGLDPPLVTGVSSALGAAGMDGYKILTRIVLRQLGLEEKQ